MSSTNIFYQLVVVASKASHEEERQSSHLVCLCTCLIAEPTTPPPWNFLSYVGPSYSYSRSVCWNSIYKITANGVGINSIVLFISLHYSAISMDANKVILLIGSWQDVETVKSSTAYQQAMSQVCSKKHVLYACLSEEDTIHHMLDPFFEVIEDKILLRTYLTEYSIMSLPTVLVFPKADSKAIVHSAPINAIATAEATTTETVKYPSGLVKDGEDDIDNAENDLFNRAMDAYEAFNIPLSATLFENVLYVNPKRQSAYFNMAVIMHMCNYPTLALNYTEQLLLLNPDDATAKSFLWSLASSPEGKVAGISVYQRLTASSSDPQSKHRLAQLTGKRL